MAASPPSATKRFADRPVWLKDVDVTGYSALACRARWIQLQTLRKSRGVAAVIIGSGPDVSFNGANEVALSWLLLGISGRELLASTVDTAYSECFVCIRADRTYIFCKRSVQQEVVMRTALWEAVTVIVPSEEDEADADKYEALKIGAFIDMVKSCSSLGVFVRELDTGHDLKMTVERWPLVQAFGFDDYGHGFLTLRRHVVNLEAEFQQKILAAWDLQSMLWARSLISKLQKAWEDALLCYDSHAGKDFLAVSPLLDYFLYGRLSMTDEDVVALREGQTGAPALQLNPAPRVLFGMESEKILLGVIPTDEPPQHFAPDPLHMIWEGVDPVTGVAATRTYLLNTPFEQGASPATSAKTRALCRAYAAATHCCREILQSRPSDLSCTSDRDRTLRHKIEEILRSSFADVSGRPDVCCREVDGMGLPMQANQREVRSTYIALVFVRVSILGIVPAGGNAPLGAVSYGDSIFLTRDRTTLEAATVPLLASVPSLAFWKGPSDEERSTTVKTGLETATGVGLDWGRSVALGHRRDVRVYLEPPEQPPDPLQLGEDSLDVAATCKLATGFWTGDATGSVLGLATGSCWTYASGKVVVVTPRTGHVLLKICGTGDGVLPAVNAADGKVWVAAAEAGEPTLNTLGMKIAITTSPETLSVWRQSLKGQEAPGTLSLDWLEAGDQADDFLPVAALLSALTGDEQQDVLEATLNSGRIASRPWSESYQCVLVTGLPGSGTMDLAKALSKVMRAPLLDMAAMWDNTSSSRVFSLRDWLQANAQEWAVLCDVVQDPAELLQLCESQGLSIISHVVSVLEPFVAYPWGAARHPLLLSRTASGWVNAAFVQEGLVKNVGKSSQEHHELCSLLLKEMHSSRGGEQASMRPLTGDIIEGALRRSPSPVARFLSRPYQGMPSTHGELFQPQARLWRCFVPTSHVLDFEVLRKVCAQCLHEAAEEFILPPERSSHCPSVWKGLFCIEAKARAVDSGTSFWAQPALELHKAAEDMEIAPAKGLVLTPKGELRPPQHWQEPLSSDHGVVFWWCLLDDKAFSDDQLIAATAEVAKCGLQEPPEETIWEVDTMPVSLRAKIEEEVRLEGPPDGYYFDGVRYIRQEDCGVSMEHPSFSGRLARAAEKHNTEQVARRRLIQQVMQRPLFARACLSARPEPGRGYKS
ncbi:C20orf194 [Symbiodinium sp. CCMP2592]|nr:C20orf194 [Symbiodinium sp. CCMP2592]